MRWVRNYMGRNYLEFMPMKLVNGGESIELLHLDYVT